MKRTCIMIAATAALASTALAQRATVSAVSEKDRLTVSYTAAVVRPASDYATILTPMICSPTDTLRLEPYVVRGRRNAKKLARTYTLDRLGPLPAYTPADQAPETVSATVTLSTRQYPWIKRQPLTLVTLTESEGCCKVETLGRDESAPFAHKAPFKPVYAQAEDNTGTAGTLEKMFPVLEHISKYKPYDSSRILRKEKGALYVHFPLDRIELRRDFRDNDWRLDRICDITRQIMADTTSSVEKIQIIGLASVEGSVAHNHWLASGRAQALKRYVMANVPSVTDEMFDVVDGGEAWSEFRDQINDVLLLKQGQRVDAQSIGVEAYDLHLTDDDLAQVSLDELRSVLDIIDGESNLDRREQRLRRLNGGKTYRFLQRTLLADQRNSGYLRIYWDYVPDTVAAQINSAVGLMQQGRYDEALALLTAQHIGQDARSWNAIGVCLYMTGREQEALGWFRRAADAGSDDARRNLDQLD